jgi:hypothetical protein
MVDFLRAPDGFPEKPSRKPREPFGIIADIKFVFSPAGFIQFSISAQYFLDLNGNLSGGIYQNHVFPHHFL